MAKPGADARKSSLMTYSSGGSNPPDRNPILPEQMFLYQPNLYANNGGQHQQGAISQHAVPNGGQYHQYNGGQPQYNGAQQQQRALSPAHAELWRACQGIDNGGQGQNSEDALFEGSDHDPDPPTPPSSSSSSSSSDDSSDSSGSDDGASETGVKRSCKTKKKKKDKREKQKAAARMKIIKKIQHHVQTFQFIYQDFDDKALQKNPMDMIGVIFNLRLSLNKDSVAYAKRVKISSLK